MSDDHDNNDILADEFPSLVESVAWILSEGTVVDGRFRVVEIMASTGLSEVYRAEDLNSPGRFPEEVALKVMRTDGFSTTERERMEGRFQREMEIYPQIQHPNMVRFIAGGVYEGHVFMVLEFVVGLDLQETIRDEGGLAPQEAKRILSQCLDALGCGHKLGFVHRDFKPENVMLTRNEQGVRKAVLLDYGMAGVQRSWKSVWKRRLTRKGEIPGTAAYLAPEQIAGKVTPQSDIYAWGLVFVEALLGRPVFDGRNAQEVMMRHLKETVALPRILAQHPLGRILFRATARDPAIRYPTAEDALRELRHCDVSGLELLRQHRG